MSIHSLTSSKAESKQPEQSPEKTPEQFYFNISAGARFMRGVLIMMIEEADVPNGHGSAFMLFYTLHIMGKNKY